MFRAKHLMIQILLSHGLSVGHIERYGANQSWIWPVNKCSPIVHMGNERRTVPIILIYDSQ